VTAVLADRLVVGDRRKNTSAWASYNERRWRLEKDVLGLDERAPFVCECPSATCLSAVMLTMMEFEAAHMCPSWRAVAPEHVTLDDAAEVIVRHPHFWVIELGKLRVHPSAE
jgi:hypothetical protein